MKILFKITSLTLCLLILCSSLISCHGGIEYEDFNVTDDLKLDPEKQYEISFWAKNDTNLSQVAVYKQAIAEFEALYPNIKVNLVLYTDYGRIYSDVITNIQTGTTPNVCITYPDHVATYMTGKNIVVPLDNLISDKKYGLGGSELKFDAPTLEEMIPEFMEEGKIGGVQYALPFMRSTEALYINESYVEKLGYTVPDVITWDFIFEVSAKATEKGEDGKYLVNGQDVMIPFIYKSTDNMMIQMLKQLDAEYSTADGDILIFNDDTKEILYDIADSASKKAFSTFKISSYPANFLNAGQCIFAVDSTAGATWMGSEAPLIDIPADKLVKFDIAVRTVPQYDTENVTMISQGPSICIFNKQDPEEVLASWLFTQYLLTDGIQMGYSRTEGYLPVTKSAINSDEYKEYLENEGIDGDMHYFVKIKATKLLLENIGNTFVTPVFNGSADLRNAAGQMIENTVKRVNRGGKVDDAYIDTLYSQMISLYHLNSLGGSVVTPDGDGANTDGKLPDTDGGGQTRPSHNTPLPTGSVVLIVSFLSIWLIIAIYLLIDLIKAKKKRNNS